MIKILILILALALVSYSNQQQGVYWDYYSCPGFDNSKLIDNFTISFEPSRPIQGAESWITVTTTPKMNIFVSYVQVKIDINKIPLYDGKYEMNQFFYKGVETTKREYAPTKFGPAGRYNISTKGYNEIGELISCYDSWFLLSKK